MVETGDIGHDGFLIWLGGVDNICGEKEGAAMVSGQEGVSSVRLTVVSGALSRKPHSIRHKAGQPAKSIQCLTLGLSNPMGSTQRIRDSDSYLLHPASWGYPSISQPPQRLC